VSFFINNQKLDTPAARIFAFFRMAREQIFCAKPHCSSSFMDIAILHAAMEKYNPSMKDVADMLRIASPSATVMIDRMVLNGELVRMEDPDDRRVVRIGITEAGKKILKTGVKDSIAGMDKLLSVLDEKERTTLDKIITKIIKIER
jgi:DNA-binding MarR family transcriptional regulator